MARLIVREGPGRGTSYDLMDEFVTIGRDPTNTIQIPSETVSRAHAELLRKSGKEGDVWEIRDLNSRNGVLVNGKAVPQSALASGDEIRIGDCALKFIGKEFDTIESRDLADPTQPLVMRDVLRDEDFSARRAGARATVNIGADAHQRLVTLLELGRVAASAESFPEVFQAITAAVTENLHPHRTVPILFDERKGMLRPWVSQRGEFDKHLASIPISSTIVNYVREKRAAILSETTQKDERLRDARSILANEITSVMCAPIQIGGRLLGAIYVDRLGETEHFGKPDLELLTAIAVQAAAAIENVRIREQMGRERYVREKEARGAYDIVGECEKMQAVFRFIAKASPTEASVLIEGQSGTGKELVARAVHLNSQRRHQPFEAVNCAAIAPTLIESELFGHVKGSFTGADRDRPGRFELADGGTLFLDEIAELPEGSQSKLLRAIESGEVRRVGDVKDRKVNVRVVAATNKKLTDQIAAGKFREDLYFRLNVLHVTIPPLRERLQDIRVLAEHYLAHFGSKCGRPKLQFDAAVIALFESYPWPGNVRELRNAIERMVVMTEGEMLTVEDVPFDIRSASPSGQTESAAPAGDMLLLRDVERAHIERILLRAGGNKKEAARLLGIDRSTLYAKIKLYGLETKDEEGPG